MTRAARGGFVALAFAAFLGGCSHADYTPSTTPTANPSSTASVSPSSTASAQPTASATPVADCGTAAPGAVYIAVGSYIEPPIPPDPTYGSVYGYSIVDSSGNYPLVASPIVLKPNDTIQFTNVDPPTADDANGTSHSAAGLQTSGFPTPYSFPSAAYQPVGTTVSNSALWSTGEIASEASQLCYSQSLVLPASGTYYFGDLDFYNSVNMRDVIVISSTATE
jgi:hypothetical protein